MHGLSTDNTSDDLEWPLTPFSRSQHFSTLPSNEVHLSNCFTTAAQQPTKQPTNRHFMYHNISEITNNTVSKKQEDDLGPHGRTPKRSKTKDREWTCSPMCCKVSNSSNQAYRYGSWTTIPLLLVLFNVLRLDRSIIGKSSAYVQQVLYKPDVCPVTRPIPHTTQ